MTPLLFTVAKHLPTLTGKASRELALKPIPSVNTKLYTVQVLLWRRPKDTSLGGGHLQSGEMTVS